MENPSFKHIETLLIANRGEIASRIIRTCRKMGIRSAAVFSEADKDLPYVMEADLAINLKDNEPTASYLDMEKILQAARIAKADAIHPGYGFLSENADFARKCEEAGLIFVGPKASSIESMGSKSGAKQIMQANGVPVVPGYSGEDQGLDKLATEARNIGFPLLLKAAAGGGGKGMRRVDKVENLQLSIESAKREALSAFGNDELIIEKYIQSGRHIEVQIFGDKAGNQIHLFERECSIQRRFQKVVEESPSPALNEKSRDGICQAAVKAAKALGYEGAGTVEFIFDNESGAFYFLEVNTRLQVEHPVTEMITGLDLVQMQLEVAMGMPLRLSQSEVLAKGYAVECRLYAEDPQNDFLPSSGKILLFEYPDTDGLRVESGVASGSEISVFYDPMIAKLILWAESREVAHRKMKYVLRQLKCLGIKSNQSFLTWLFEQEEFRKGNYDTHFIQKKYKNLPAKSEETLTLFGMAATLELWRQRKEKRSLLKTLPSGWRNSFFQPQFEEFEWEGKDLKIQYRFSQMQFQMGRGELIHKTRLIDSPGNTIWMEVDGCRQHFSFESNGQAIYLTHESHGQIELKRKARFPLLAKEEIAGEYKAPMPSKIIEVCVRAGQEVKKGQALIILSSMKMENTLAAHEDGVVEEVYSQAGDSVEAELLLLKINPTQP